MRHVLILSVLLLPIGCSQSSTQHLDARQQNQLNQIAATTSETDGNDAAQNGMQANVGATYRAGAKAPPH